MQTIANQVGGGVKMPSILGDIGLSAIDGEDGVLISFALLDDVTIPDIVPPRTLRRGLNVCGRATFLGVSAIIDCVVDPFQLARDLVVEQH